MDKLEKTIRIFRAASLPGTSRHLVSPVCLLLVTLCFAGFVLSVPVMKPEMLLWFFIYPIVGSALLGESYSSIFVKSLIVLPFSLLIGIFNPIVDTTPFLQAGNLTVTAGWISFISIQLRSLLAMQGVLMLISDYGFVGLCHGLRRLRVPLFLITQLLFVYRYLTVLMQEALGMRNARLARGYGKISFPMRMWGQFIGQLFLRTLSRANAIHEAMLSRGFEGDLAVFETTAQKWRSGDTLFLIVSVVMFILMRYADLSALVAETVTHTS